MPPSPPQSAPRLSSSGSRRQKRRGRFLGVSVFLFKERGRLPRRAGRQTRGAEPWHEEAVRNRDLVADQHPIHEIVPIHGPRPRDEIAPRWAIWSLGRGRLHGSWFARRWIEASRHARGGACFTLLLDGKAAPRRKRPGVRCICVASLMYAQKTVCRCTFLTLNSDGGLSDRDRDARMDRASFRIDFFFPYSIFYPLAIIRRGAGTR